MITLVVTKLRGLLKFRIVEMMLSGLLKKGRGQVLAKRPGEIRLSSQPGYRWKKPVAISKLIGPLAARGFTDLGPYRIELMPEVTVRLLVNPTVSVYACVYEHAKAGMWLDLTSRYEDGSRTTFTTLRSNGLDQRPQNMVVCAPSASSEALYGRMLRERPQRTLLRLDPGTVIRLAEAAYAEQAPWRAIEGVSACEASKPGGNINPRAASPRGREDRPRLLFAKH